MRHRLVTLGCGALGLLAMAMSGAAAQSHTGYPPGPFGFAGPAAPTQAFGFSAPNAFSAPSPPPSAATAFEQQGQRWIQLERAPNVQGSPSFPAAPQTAQPFATAPAAFRINPTSPPQVESFDGIEGTYLGTDITFAASELGALEEIVGAEALAMLAVAEGESFTLMMPEGFDGDSPGVLVPDGRPEDAVALPEWQEVARSAFAPAAGSAATAIAASQTTSIGAAAELRDSVCDQGLDPEVVEMTVTAGGTSATLQWTDGSFCAQ